MATILLVEANKRNRDALGARLEEWGYAVLPAVDGQHAILRARAAKPDLILMDLDVPLIDGWMPSLLLKAECSTDRIPLIVLGAHGVAGGRELALSAGADEFHARPISFELLLAKIETLVRPGGTRALMQSPAAAADAMIAA